MAYLKLFANSRKPAPKLEVTVVIRNYYFYLANLLRKWLFQPEAPSDGAAVVAEVEGEPLRVHGSTHAQANSPQKDAKADAIAERAKVWGSEF
jgi:hypothetical protein